MPAALALKGWLRWLFCAGPVNVDPPEVRYVCWHVGFCSRTVGFCSWIVGWHVGFCSLPALLVYTGSSSVRLFNETVIPWIFIHCQLDSWGSQRSLGSLQGITKAPKALIGPLKALKALKGLIGRLRAL